MDTSKTYINMRLAAIPDMGLGEKPLRPYHFVKGIPDLSKQVVIDLKGNWYHITTKTSEVCQLERQDQLQEMVRRRGDDGVDLHAKLASFVYDWSQNYGGWSMEQLWLAFVMKGNNKVWDGENWIKEKGG